jgi:GNAT superfamily N-acetyltransferase
VGGVSEGARRPLDARAATPDDDPAVLDLLRTSLGWRPEDDDEALFVWKHRDNVFGRSPSWVAVSDGAIVGYRTFMRWEFVGDDGAVVTAVRAVDTVTHPDFRGRGIFKTLTLQAVGELTLAGTGIVFNTPNDQSRPGYLRMGWSLVGRLPTGIVPAAPSSVPTVLRARVPADLWSQPTRAGRPAPELLADGSAAAALLAHAPHQGFRTRRTPEYLRWRTQLPGLHYRVLLAGRDPAEGGLVFRVRRRGPAVELVVVEELVPDLRTGWRLLRRALEDTAADYAIGLRSAPAPGLLPLPGQGPLLTSRPLAATPPARGRWRLTLGDVELF